MRRLVAAWIAFALCTAASADTGGELDDVYEKGRRIDLHADSIEWESARRLYVARGNVVIRQGQRELRADFAAYSTLTRRGVASGDVFFTDGKDTLTTSFAEFDVDTLQGVMFDAEFVDAGTLKLRGDEIRRVGERRYTFRNGEFTSCRCPDPEAREPWHIEADEADLEVQGYGTARNATFEVLGVPVLWLPWMIYPLKTRRQSGVLLPEFAISGRNGFEVGLPLFAALGDPVNLTVTPRWLQDRGVKGDARVEYVLGEDSGGDLFGSFIHDREVRPDTRKTPFGKDRWTTFGEHDFFLPAGWRIRTDYAFVSDNSYPNDFDELARRRNDRFLPSTGFVSNALGKAGAFGVVGAARYAEDLQNPDDTDRDDNLLQRLPEAGFRALPTALPFARWLAPALDVHYVYFHQSQRPRADATGGSLVTSNGRFLDTGIDGIENGREQGRTVVDAAAPDPNGDNFTGLVGGTPFGSEGDGVFQEGELLADDGHRVRFHPRLGAPLRLFDAVEFHPEVGWSETLYGSDAQGFERRGFLTGRAELATRLRGRFGALTHLLEPRLSWALVTDTSQRGNPLYVPRTAVPQDRVRELDLDNVTRDPSDRIHEFNGLTFALGNRLFTRPDEAGQGAQLLGDFVLSALYDFAGSEFGNLYLDGRFYPFEGASARFSLGVDPRHPEVSEGLVGLAWYHERGHRFSLDYRFLDDAPRVFEAFPEENRRFDDFEGEFDQLNQLGGGFRVAITRQWGITYRGIYSFERSLLIANQGGIEYISKCRCWAVRLEVSQSRSRGVGIGFRYTFLGIGDDTRTPFESVGARDTELGGLAGPTRGRGS